MGQVLIVSKPWKLAGPHATTRNGNWKQLCFFGFRYLIIICPAILADFISTVGHVVPRELSADPLLPSRDYLLQGLNLQRQSDSGGIL
jgi:hypothetical protein